LCWVFSRQGPNNYLLWAIFEPWSSWSLPLE
jgi:hypothetical protein